MFGPENGCSSECDFGYRHLCDRILSEGRVIMGKGSFQNLVVGHDACVGPWALWYHLLSKEMWLAHVRGTVDLLLVAAEVRGLQLMCKLTFLPGGMAKNSAPNPRSFSEL